MSIPVQPINPTNTIYAILPTHRYSLRTDKALIFHTRVDDFNTRNFSHTKFLGLIKRERV